ncbi:MAG: lysylphosphatidylglycerol synthase domain-containing protein [Acidobacteria bacterium]|jgi:uncharacterized membrane protein YbhN (UPF0104 family)|nr:lysylphosphatidylglycerol synthase domain-containing protein [Acidobacteriota bacterium]MCU0252967.1 lysylphosphatidylglycerol synthase domain-containing protein [Acidobacteriota bacterium]
MRRLPRHLGRVVGIALFLLAIYALRSALRDTPWSEVREAFRGIPRGRLALSALLVAANYLALSSYDLLGLRYLRLRLPVPKVVFASFQSYALSQNLGLPLVTGGSVRLRFYRRWGFGTTQVGALILFGGVTFWLGFLLLAGLLFLVHPMPLPPELRIPPAWVRPLGIAMLLCSAAYIYWAAGGRQTTIDLNGVELGRPGWKMALAQFAASTIDWLLAAASFFVLLPEAAGISYTLALTVFLIAAFAGNASQVPGGLGVFETVALWLLSPHLPAAQIAGVLIAFRAFYFVLPLVVATALFGLHTLRGRKPGAATSSR